MGFLNDRKDDAKAAAADGRPGDAADIVIHALLEGPGNILDNLMDMSSDDKSK
ncbi:hypothetical protein AB0L80_39440 [Streptomyces sp. NPDC052069]|uniref:hypothetical protein n=1 Tax=Streptomyces sp. NPDC052069 TaxID=3154650 RepID=UPI0034198FD1